MTELLKEYNEKENVIDITVFRGMDGKWIIEFPVFDKAGNLANDKAMEFILQLKNE